MAFVGHDDESVDVSRQRLSGMPPSANPVVACGAEQMIVCSMERGDSNKTSYEVGEIEVTWQRATEYQAGDGALFRELYWMSA